MKQTLDNIRGKINIFMSGRYGTDELERALMIVWLVLILVSGFGSALGIGTLASLILSLLCIAMAAIVIFRFLSRKIFKRSAENDKYLKLKNGSTEFFHLQKLRYKERKTNVYKKCPHCKKVMRLARVGGKHTVRCPMCGGTFKVNIRGGNEKK